LAEQPPAWTLGGIRNHVTQLYAASKTAACGRPIAQLGAVEPLPDQTTCEPCGPAQNAPVR
jgi:hypothetical protein